MADVQLQKGVVVRRVGQREAALLAVLEQDVDVLPGQNCRRSLAGSRRCISMTSGASFSSFSMREGRVLTGMSLAEVIACIR
jgi:hypothetical protein